MQMDVIVSSALSTRVCVRLCVAFFFLVSYFFTTVVTLRSGRGLFVQKALTCIVFNLLGYVVVMLLLLAFFFNFCLYVKHNNWLLHFKKQQEQLKQTIKSG